MISICRGTRFMKLINLVKLDSCTFRWNLISTSNMVLLYIRLGSKVRSDWVSLG